MSVVAYEANHELSEYNGVATSGISVVRYAKDVPASDRQKRRALGVWIGGAVAAGLACGLIASTGFPATAGRVSHSILGQEIVGHSRAPLDVAQTVVPVDYPSVQVRPSSKRQFSGVSPNAGVEAIKARNRRLEALVKVLRRRDSNERSSGVSHSN